MKRLIIVLVCIMILPSMVLAETEYPTLLVSEFPRYQEEVLQSGKTQGANFRKAEQHKVLARFLEDMQNQNGEIELYMLPLTQVQQHADVLEIIPAQGTLSCMTAEGLHAFMADMVLLDGQAVAMPVTLECNTIAYSRSVAEMLGIAPEDMPATWAELLTFLQNGEANYGEAAKTAGVYLFPQGIAETRAALTALLKDRGVSEDMLAEVEKISYSEPDGDRTLYFSIQGPESYLQLADKPDYLFTCKASMLPENRMHWIDEKQAMGDFQPMNLPLIAGEKPAMVMRGTALVINPYSQNHAGAIELLQFLADPEEMVKHVAADNLLLVSSRKDQQPAETVEYRILTGNDAAGEQMAELEKIRWQISETALAEYRIWLAESDVVWAE